MLIHAERSPAVLRRCGGHACSTTGCAGHRTEAETHLGASQPVQLAGTRRGRPEAAAGVPGSVGRTLSSPGRPLDAVVRKEMGVSFAADFTDVRVHDDSSAADSADMVGARAYTVGNHVVFRRGAYAPGSPDGVRLLRHELTHVLQQRAAGTSPSSPMRLGDTHDPAEVEAERAEDGPPARSASAVAWSPLEPGTTPLQRTPVRGDLLTAGQEQTDRPMRGNDAHREITKAFMADVAPFTRLRIPSGTRAPFVDPESCSADSEPTLMSPLLYNDNPRSRSGEGIPDLVFRQPGRIELAEIKPASWSCALFGETQVANYVSKGNGDQGYGSSPPAIPGTEFATMAPSRWPQLPRHQRLQAVNLTFDWVGDGVVGYLATRGDDRDTLICGVADAGRIDAFVQNAMSPAMELLEGLVNTELNRRLSSLIEQLSLQAMLERVLGPGTASTVLSQLDERLRRQLELELRSALHSVKDRIVREVGERVRARLREILAEILVAACVTGLVLTTRELMRRLRDRLRQVVWEESLVVARAEVEAAMRTVVYVAAAALVVVLAAVLIALLLADDASGIGVLDDPLIVPLTAAAARAAQVLAQAGRWIVPLLVRLATAATPTFAGGLSGATP